MSIAQVLVFTVLHVEDEDGAAFLFRRALREAGFTALVFRVSNGEEALAFLRKSGAYVDAERPHLIVLDLNLPKIDGLSVLGRIRNDESLRSIPVVAISTSSRQADKEKALSLGARHYIVKPDSFEELTEKVKAACTAFLAGGFADPVGGNMGETRRTKKELLTATYEAFNARDIDAVLAILHPDVDWPNGMEGGRIRGRSNVRDYWRRQWGMIDPRVEPLRIEDDENGRTVVEVHQVARDLAGNILVDQIVHHVYSIQNDLVERMDIEKPGETPAPEGLA